MTFLLLASLAHASPYSPYIEGRNLAGFRAQLTHGPVSALALGNSIMAGGWVDLLQAAQPGLRVTNTAVGGAQISQMGFVVAPILPGGASAFSSARPSPALKGRQLALVGGTRNEAGLVQQPLLLNAERVLYEGVLDALLAAGVEPVLVSDPPQIDMQSGERTPLSLESDSKLVALQRDVARSKGVTFVDVWAQFVAMQKAGTDLRPFYIDGTHPQARGQAIMAAMVRSALTEEPSVQVPRGPRSALGLAVTYPVAGPQSQLWSAPVSPLSSPLSTQFVLGRSEAVTLAPGDTASFKVPAAKFAWADIVLQPRCEGALVNWNYAGKQFTQDACSGLGTTVHREQTELLGELPAGPVVLQNDSVVRTEAVGLLLALPR